MLLAGYISGTKSYNKAHSHRSGLYERSAATVDVDLVSCQCPDERDLNIFYLLEKNRKKFLDLIGPLHLFCMIFIDPKATKCVMRKKKMKNTKKL